MDYTKFSGTYTVRRLLRDDIPSIFALCEKNPQFYEHCPPFVTPEKWDYQYIRLGYVDGNEQSRSFWLKNQFTDTGLRDHTNDYTVVVMNRFLTKV